MNNIDKKLNMNNIDNKLQLISIAWIISLSLLMVFLYFYFIGHEYEGKTIYEIFN